jgi:hypothetical protein
MRRALVFLMIVTGIVMIVIGFAEAHVHPEALATHHITAAAIFVLLCLAHILLNRKAVIKYFKG